MNSDRRLRLAVFDLAGTTVDCGCFSPVTPFVDAFAQQGVTVSTAEARGPMGLSKRDHVAALLALPGLAERWRLVHGEAPGEGAVDAVYEAFVPLQLAAAARHAELVAGLLPLQETLRRRGLAIATTTGYFRAAAEIVWEAMRSQGFVPDLNVCPDDVDGVGRPAPAMIHRAMEQLGIESAATVVKVGDTVPDIAEGLAAGCWSLGVTRTGSDVGCTPEQFEALPAAEQSRRLSAAEAALRQAGAQVVLPSIAELEPALDTIDGWLAAGRTP